MKTSKLKLLLPCGLLLLTYILLFPLSITACTIVSGIAVNGHVWNANNEDGTTGVANFINVFPKPAGTKYGYYTLSHFSPKFGEGGNMQGGMNEAGLTFDFNAIKHVKDFDPKCKKAFPQGDDAILPYLLANMDSVQQVIEFFKTYWFQNGFHSAQMHVADRHGRFAIISGSGIELAEKGQPLVSTNFDICGKEDGSYCTAFPIATKKLATEGASLTTMMAILREVAQGENTLYSNVQNLTTGDIWFFSNHDPGKTVRVNIRQLLSKGRISYTFSDLTSLTEKRPGYRWRKPKSIALADSVKSRYVGTYQNEFTGDIVVQTHTDGIVITTADGRSAIMPPQSKNVFFFTQEDVRVDFIFDKKKNRWIMRLHENGFWAFSAFRPSTK
jgi:hypothetical protein